MIRDSFSCDADTVPSYPLSRSFTRSGTLRRWFSSPSQTLFGSSTSAPATADGGQRLQLADPGGGLRQQHGVDATDDGRGHLPVDQGLGSQVGSYQGAGAGSVRRHAGACEAESIRQPPDLSGTAQSHQLLWLHPWRQATLSSWCVTAPCKAMVATWGRYTAGCLIPSSRRAN